MDIVAQDAVGDLNKFIYEDTAVGKAINDASFFKYDGSEMQGVRNVSKSAFETIGATYLAVQTGGASLAVNGGLGFLSGFGNSAEELFSDKENRSFYKDVGLASINGVGKAVQTIAIGKTGAGVYKAASLVKDMGIKTAATTAKIAIKNTVKNFNVKSIINSDFMKSTLNKTFKDADFYLDTIGVAADNVSEAYTGWLKTGEFNLDYGKLGKELAITGGINVLAASIQSLTEMKPLVDIDSFDVENSMMEYNRLIQLTKTQDFKDYINVRNAGDPSFIPVEDYEQLIKDINNLENQLNYYYNFKMSHTDTAKTANLALKQEILSTCSPELDEISKARKLYIELNKRMNYDINYIKATPGIKSSMYWHNVSFENLSGHSVICKGWSELYQELLLESGFSPDQVRIVGVNDKMSHKWIEIVLSDGNILIADATENIGHSVDLAACKAGLSTTGFFYGDASYSGSRLSKLQNVDLQAIGKSWLQTDQYLGYVSNYTDDLINKADELFSGSQMYKSIVGENSYSSLVAQLVDIEIPKNMDGFESYIYFSKMYRLLFDAQDQSSISVQLNFHLVHDQVEGLTTVITNDKCMIYSSSLGKMIFDTYEDFSNYISGLKFLN